jgi:chromosome segregation ATPase
MKSLMERSLETIKNKDYAIEKMKKDFEQFIKSKDQKIEALEQRINSMKNDQSQSREISNDSKVEKLENENKSLHFKLELANKKVSIVTEKMGQREIDINAKRERDIEALKGNLKIAHSIIEEMKMEKAKLESRAHEDHEQLKKNKEEVVIKKSDDEKDSIIQVLSADRKGLEEKLRAQGIELKKAEQKLKYTLSQLESANKKKPAVNPNLKSAEVLSKQLEQASSRMAEATAEVIEKRREIVKVKQENSMMSAKISELEKKLANLDKKVA